MRALLTLATRTLSCAQRSGGSGGGKRCIVADVVADIRSFANAYPVAFIQVAYNGGLHERQRLRPK